jgi:hypothetical protein
MTDGKTLKNIDVNRLLSAHHVGLIEAALRHWALSETHHGRAPSELASDQARKLADEIMFAEVVCIGEFND